ncbi:signal peptide peptidase [Klebsormidium nitens]|uniref:Signal peptide peptidase n=1 Tax=Klebsormidium nitens TaxID=105231 RepID=A0A0U9HT31_KLENI|nr:signal peptide peptidase [Klebsormidium nitens]|eukprot:GAQ83835.1 signal peptide peptidase [Klebsormidium nitens]
MAPLDWIARLENVAFAALTGVSLLPLVMTVNSNYNVVITACLTVLIGCLRSVKPMPPTETMSRDAALRFPLIGSAVLFSLFLLFKFLPKDLVNTVLTLYFVCLGVLALSATIVSFLFFLPKSWHEKRVPALTLPFIGAVDLELDYAQVFAAIPSTAFCAWYFMEKHWLANNALGLAFSIQGIEMLSLGSFKIGAILLCGLFVYDIFWVFCTPVMVSVAKSFDAPIKLLFPTGIEGRPFSMLGLGDIVIPGIFVALALRFDVSRKTGPRYFWSSFAGYTFGLGLTIVVMNVFQAAQPALLYIVPAVISFLGTHCAWNGEFKHLLAFDESAVTEKVDAIKAEGETESNEHRELKKVK